ncbi:hypothetical protein RHMOL_Rhmol04G0239400 [Rhododendron molle]|uniref:Uncharacterized protein n=1 Tax=Rhododendron molle TaxID=49168 RepID=A0ACC0P4X2_RHOML|nr:hypothetical protein RHMOL_Rhmol04G0239400 [Rhododendron molle]
MAGRAAIKPNESLHSSPVLLQIWKQASEHNEKMRRWSPPPPRRPGVILKALRGGGLGIAAMAYVGVDYLRYLSPSLHERLQPALWTVLALVAVSRVPFYKHWSAELRSALPFVAAMLFMLSALLFEALSVRFVTAVLGLDWHRYCPCVPI